MLLPSIVLLTTPTITSNSTQLMEKVLLSFCVSFNVFFFTLNLKSHNYCAEHMWNYD